ncbi:MAG: FAD-dependent oxidoreductase, partial [Candidatus Nitrosopolaris sp.]
ILVNSGSKILPEVTEDLAEFALQELRKDGVEVILNTRLVGAEREKVKLSNGVTILCNTLVWTGGISPDHLVRKLECGHDKAGTIIANNHLEILGFKDAFALGDCASIKDPRTGNSYPPTVQYALRQARVAANNIISVINGGSAADAKTFDYKTKGMMALIGQRNGVGILLGHKVHGFTAWWLWRSYYLGTTLMHTYNCSAEMAISPSSVEWTNLMLSQPLVFYSSVAAYLARSSEALKKPRRCLTFAAKITSLPT